MRRLRFAGQLNILGMCLGVTPFGHFFGIYGLGVQLCGIACITAAWRITSVVSKELDNDQ
jgi:hypothetical protein